MLSKLSVEVYKDIISIVGADNIIVSEPGLTVYESDAFTLYRSKPVAVAFPSTTEQVQKIVRLCNQHSIPFLARGYGSSLSGGAIPANNALIIELVKMNKILEFDSVNRCITVQAGVLNMEINNFVNEQGFFYAPDPGSQQASTIGGNIGHNAGGMHCLKYGVTVNHVTGMTFVTGSGEILKIGGKSEESSGYDLIGLITGSEGTLGIVAEATLKLLPNPEYSSSFMAMFDSVENAGTAASEIIGSGIIPAAMEIIDNNTIRAIERSEYALGIDTNTGAVMVVELDGMREEVEEELNKSIKICRNLNADIYTARNSEEKTKIWKARKVSYGAMGSIKPQNYLIDVTVPRSQLPAILSKITELSKKYNIYIANFFHAGDGNVHPVPLFNIKDLDETQRALKIAKEIIEESVKLGGTITGEHGVGLEKRGFMKLLYSFNDLKTMKLLKRVFDPNYLTNKGKIFPDDEAKYEISYAGLKAYEGELL